MAIDVSEGDTSQASLPPARQKCLALHLAILLFYPCLWHGGCHVTLGNLQPFSEQWFPLL